MQKCMGVARSGEGRNERALRRKRFRHLRHKPAAEVLKHRADVAIVARNPDTLEATRAELAADSGRRILGVTVDTADDNSVRAMARQVLDAFGRIEAALARKSVIMPDDSPDHLFWCVAAGCNGSIRART